jgi:hypothetical protein
MASLSPLVLFTVGVALLVTTPLASGKLVCALDLQGYGTTPGVKSVVMSCSGGTITAAAHGTLLAAPAHQFSGVKWLTKGACGAETPAACLINICEGSSATFVSANVLHVNASGLAGDLVCIHDSNVTFQKALFQDNTGRCLVVTGQRAQLHLMQSRFGNNSASGPKDVGGALHMLNGTAIVEDTTFAGNSVGSGGGVIGLEGAAKLTLVSSVLDGNKGESDL